MTDYRLCDSIFDTLNRYGVAGSKSAKTFHERLGAFDKVFLTELNDFLTEVDSRRIHSVIRAFSNALFRLSPEVYEYTTRPFLDHYIKLCDTISQQAPGQWGTLCRGLISGLDNYTGHRDRTLTLETTTALLHAAAAVLASEPKTLEEEWEFKHVTYYYSLPEGELLDFIVKNPDASTRLSAMFMRGTTRIAELAAAVDQGASLSLTVGAL